MVIMSLKYLQDDVFPFSLVILEAVLAFYYILNRIQMGHRFCHLRRDRNGSFKSHHTVGARW